MDAERRLESVKQIYHEVHKSSPVNEKIAFYNTWARNYDQDCGVMEWTAPKCAAKSISSHFKGDRDAAVILDVACGTGMVAKQLRDEGFAKFVGIDGSQGMIEKAKMTGLYQDLKQCILGLEPLPALKGSFDVVVISGALSVGHIDFSVARELCNACKTGGYVCMTCRHGDDNVGYKAALEHELQQMEEEGLWSCVNVTEVENWERSSSKDDDGYISGTVYFYQKI